MNRNTQDFTSAGGDDPASLAAILRTEELSRRPARAPDVARENRALAALARALNEPAQSIFQTMAATLLTAFQCGSAGFSVLAKDGQRFVWPAIAGAWRPYLGGGTPREFSPCGEVLDRDAPLLFSHWERRYRYLLTMTPPPEEGLVVPFHAAGKAVGTIWIVSHDGRRRFDAEDLRLLECLRPFAAAAYRTATSLDTDDQRRAALNLMEDAVESRQTAERLNADLRASEARLARELAATQQLHAISALLIESGDTTALYQKIVEAAAAIMHADMASMQMVDEDEDALRLLAFRGFDPAFGRTFEWVGPEAGTACSVARRRERRVIVPDVETCDFMAGTPVLEQFRQIGIRAIQSTPLVSRGGRLLGMISTHWGAPHTPAQSDLALLDILARQAADIIEYKRTEQASSRLAAIVESSDDAIVSKTLDGIVTSWNRGAERLFGYTAAEALGQPITLIIPAERLAEEADVLARLRRGEAVEHFETERVTKDGRRVSVSLAISPMRDAAGRVLGASKVARDITGRKQAEDALRASEERLRFMAESMPQKIFTAKPSGEIDYFNRQWTEYAGVPFEALHEREWTQLIHPDDVAETWRAWRSTVDSGAPFQTEHRWRRADGVYRWHLSRAHAMRDAAGAVTLWIGSSTDVHEVKEADDRKNEFLALLAHELRNPLAPISSMLEVLKRAPPGGAPVAQARAMMERQVRQLTRLIDDLLDVSRISRGKLGLRRVDIDLVSIVHSAIEASRPALASARHELTLALPEAPVYLHADPVRLAQVIGNLLNNAAKYTEPGGRIVLTVERHADEVAISVKDNGIGIAPAVLPRLFNMFMQIDPASERGQGGLGIGLALVRRLVEMHGGSVTAFSEGLGRGSEFTVRLPALTQAPAAPLVPAAAPVSLSSRRRLLVVDDNRDILESLVTLLQLAGHETRAASDGMEALAVGAAFKPEVILLDLGLPKVSGYDVARRIRAEPWGHDIVLVAVTGWGQDADRQKSKEAGFDGHLVKPVEYSALLNLLSELLAARSGVVI